MDRTRILGLIRLFRLELPLTAGACVVLGQIMALGSLPSLPRLFLGFMAFFSISATALILNDYFDYESDKINAPERPLPSGAVTKRDVVLLSTAVALAGFGAAALIGPIAVVVTFVVWGLGLLYNWRLKRTGFPGNLVVSFSVGMTFVFGGISVGIPYDRIVWWFALFAGLINLGEEIASDAMDIEGDRQAGSYSLAVVWGQRRALLASGAIFLLVILVSIIPFVWQWLAWYYLVPIAVFDGITLFSTVRLLQPKTPDRRKYIKAIYRTGSIMVLSIIVIRLVG
jgi:geranylgeranylglycerol-phosphate geranylgeranyltransferase